MSVTRLPTLTTLALCLALPVHAADKAKVVTLYNFMAGDNGAGPSGPLISQGGVVYGTTSGAGPSGNGTVYGYDIASDTETTLYGFSSQDEDGDQPNTGVVYHDGVLFGTTPIGGITGFGTVFTVNPKTGAERVIYTFAGGMDGQSPASALIYHRGAFYGVTSEGGAAGQGTFFKLDPATNAERVVYSFGGGADAVAPLGSLLYMGAKFYGTSYQGGDYYKGAIFSVDSKTGRESVIYSFRGGILGDGSNPQSGVISQGGLFYGVTSAGGNQGCTDQKGCGTIFQLDPASGKETVLYSFKGKRDGADPVTALTYIDGTLYGTTASGNSGYGTLFSYNLASGTFTTIYDCSAAKGANPQSPLLYLHHQLYGTFIGGNTGNSGTIFKLKP